MLTDWELIALAGGALATCNDAVNCCVATLPEEAVEAAEAAVAAVEIFGAGLLETTAAVAVLA